MALETLALPAIMLTALLLLVWGISSRGWRSYEIGTPPGSNTGRFLNWLWSSPVAWLLTFVLVTVAFSFAAVFAVSGGEIVSLAGGTALTVVLGGIGLLLACFLFLGTYFSIRSRGAPNSMAAVLSATLMGFLVLGIVTLRLAGLV